MKYTLTRAEFNEATGVSTVVISTRYGHFKGEVQMQESEQYPSKYFGCELAEIKALKKAEKARLRELRAQLDALQSYFCDMMNTRTFDGYSFQMLKLGERMVELRRNIDVTKHNIKTLSDNYHSLIVQRDAKLAEFYSDRKEGNE